MRNTLTAEAIAHSPIMVMVTNRCHHFRGFVYQHARFSTDKKSIEVAVRPRRRSAAICSRCHQPAPRYEQLGERRFEFIPLWGFLIFFLYAMRRVDCRRFKGPLRRAYRRALDGSGPF